MTAVGQRAYNFSSITFGDTSVAGNFDSVRDILYAVGTGYQYVEPHEWEWYRLYYFNTMPDGELLGLLVAGSIRKVRC